jgi:hypothetical protein
VKPHTLNPGERLASDVEPDLPSDMHGEENMAYQRLRTREYECLPLETSRVAAPALKREFAWMERLFEEWFVTLDELKRACEAKDIRRIRALADRSDCLVNAIGNLQPPPPRLREQQRESSPAPVFRFATHE